MSVELGVLVIHGMGSQSPADFERQVAQLRAGIGRYLSTAEFDRISFSPFYYHDLMQGNQARVWQRSSSKVGMHLLRKALLYGFSDATTLEIRPHEPNSVYAQLQQRLFTQLSEFELSLGAGGKVAIIAHSLGGQVISNYLWDAQKFRLQQSTKSQLWKRIQAEGIRVSPFADLSALKTLVTLGCNIPVFVAGRSDVAAVYTDQGPFQFDWHNIYDKHDSLGWPLTVLGDRVPDGFGQAYSQAICSDQQINAYRNWWALLTKSWHTSSHDEYWYTRAIQKRIAKFLQTALAE